ncbi:hypothetical protein EsDP_00003458 [Epichloe bromicola]|uniref:Uncharacterized protein n=1 Tax=Epichloe bromicola TaxID=79588 RepID=A0ABQ0CNX3_9HYPO
MSCSTYGQDVENQVGTEGCLGSKTLEKTLLRSQRNIYDWAGQGCFLCLESPEEGHYAVMVPCIKPSTSRRIVRRFKTPIYEKMQPWEMAYEADDEVWRRLVHACYQYRGKWKRFIPFYGITEVQEVTPWKCGLNHAFALRRNVPKIASSDSNYDIV